MYIDLNHIEGKLDLNKGVAGDKIARAESKPLIIYSERTLPEGGAEKYKEMYRPAAQKIWDDVAGCRTIMSIPHESKPNVWLDIQWFNDQNAFNQHVDMSNKPLMDSVMGWVGTYDMSHPFTGTVWGDWHEGAQKATGGFGAQFKFLENQAGFIK